MPKYYVTMTWDNWPEGGSFGTVVEAADTNEAEKLCRKEMAETRFDPELWDSPEAILSTYSNKWHLVDCFLVQDFIDQHGPKPEIDPRYGSFVRGH